MCLHSCLTATANIVQCERLCRATAGMWDVATHQGQRMALARIVVILSEITHNSNVPQYVHLRP